MRETMPEVQLEALRRMTPEQKVQAVESLRRTAGMLVEAGVRMRGPDWSEEQVLAETRRLMNGADA